MTAAGFGLARLLHPEASPDGSGRALSASLRVVLIAPWYGFIVVGAVCSLLGLTGAGLRFAWILAALLSAALFWFSSRQRRPEFDPRTGTESDFSVHPLVFLAAVVPAAWFFLWPLWHAHSALTTFSLANNDPYFYVVSSHAMETENYWRYIAKGHFGFSLPVNLADKIVDSHVALNPRWLPLQALAFFSAAFRMPPENLFSLVNILAFALIPSLLWIFLKDTLEFPDWAAALALALCVFNPPILYVLYHGFLPQILATGFLIGFLTELPDWLRRKEQNWKFHLRAGLWFAGILSSYLEIALFAGGIAGAYALYLGATRVQRWAPLLQRGGALILCALAFSPYQAFRFFPFLWEYQIKGGIRTGWDVTKHYYLFLFPLGGIFSGPILDAKPRMERIFNPFLAILVAAGLWKSRPRGYLAIVALPFIASGALAYSRDYNYAYFKNITYAFFLLPAIVSAGALGFFGWLRRPDAFWRNAAGGFFAALFLFLAAQSATKSVEFINWVGRNHLAVTERHRALADAAKTLDPSAGIYVSDALPIWDSLWAVYFLGPRRAGSHFFGVPQDAQGVPIPVEFLLAPDFSIQRAAGV